MGFYLALILPFLAFSLASAANGLWLEFCVSLGLLIVFAGGLRSYYKEIIPDRWVDLAKEIDWRHTPKTDNEKIMNLFIKVLACELTGVLLCTFFLCCRLNIQSMTLDAFSFSLLLLPLLATLVLPVLGAYYYSKVKYKGLCVDSVIDTLELIVSACFPFLFVFFLSFMFLGLSPKEFFAVFFGN